MATKGNPLIEPDVRFARIRLLGYNIVRCYL